MGVLELAVKIGQTAVRRPRCEVVKRESAVVWNVANDPSDGTVDICIRAEEQEYREELGERQRRLLFRL